MSSIPKEPWKLWTAPSPRIPMTIILSATAPRTAPAARVELLRTTVDRSGMQADIIFGQFAPVASVGQTADEVGVNVVTDPALTTAYLQIAPASDEGWEQAKTSCRKNHHAAGSRQ